MRPSAVRADVGPRLSKKPSPHGQISSSHVLPAPNPRQLRPRRCETDWSLYLVNAEYFWSGDIPRDESTDPGRPRQVLLTTSVRFR